MEGGRERSKKETKEEVMRRGCIDLLSPFLTHSLFSHSRLTFSRIYILDGHIYDEVSGGGVSEFVRVCACVRG